MKRFIRAVLPAAVFLALLSFFTVLLLPKPERDREVMTDSNLGFYDEEKNTLDVMYFGSSHAYIGISPMEMYEEYGFTGYVRGSPVQKLLETDTLIRESLKYQSPKVIVIEVALIYNVMPQDETNQHTLFDTMRLSAEKLRGVAAATKSNGTKDAADYLFPILRYHERWKELNADDLYFFTASRHNVCKGYEPTFNVKPVPPENIREYSADEAAFEYHESVEEYMRGLKALCDQRGIALALVKIPTQRGSYWDGSKHSATAELAEKLGVRFIDYNYGDLTGIDWATDTGDAGDHLNHRGAVKASHVLGQWLVDSYDLPDRRGDPAYAQWETDLARYRENMAAGAAGAETVK